MKKLFLSVVCIIALTGTLLAIIGVPYPTAVTIYEIKQGFEGTGYDNGETWTPDTGAPNEDPDDTSFAIEGSQNLACRRTSTGCETFALFVDQGAGTNLNEIWCYFAFKTSTVTVNNILVMTRTNTTEKNFVRISATGKLQVFDSAEATSASTSASVSSNTTYHALAHWNNTTGVGDIEFATTATFTGSGTQFASFTGGETGMKFNRLVCEATTANTTNLFDKVRVSHSVIGSNPQ